MNTTDEQNHVTLETAGAPIKAWTVGVPFEAVGSAASAYIRRNSPARMA